MQDAEIEDEEQEDEAEEERPQPGRLAQNIDEQKIGRTLVRENMASNEIEAGSDITGAKRIRQRGPVTGPGDMAHRSAGVKPDGGEPGLAPRKISFTMGGHDRA